MGSSSSVHASSGTFLTACDYEEGFGWQPEDSASDEEEVVDEEESQGIMRSVATEDYIPPPNKFYTYTDFDVIKKRHYDLKGKYESFLSNFMKQEIPQSIQHAKEISKRELRDNGGRDKNHRYVIDPYILQEMDTRGSVHLVNMHKKDMLNSVKLNVAHRNRALACRNGVDKASMALHCATYMDEKPSEFRHTMDYLGVDESKTEKKSRYKLNDMFDDDEHGDSATMIEFRKHFEGRKKRAIIAERRKGTWMERYQGWKRRMKERFINYDYE